jgi:DNA-directed RNA polymerase subunit M/transcription elongation factor TFIIS
MKNMEFACPNCLHSGLLFERVITILHDVYDIKESDGRIVDWKVDKALKTETDKKVVAFCSKCGLKSKVFNNQQELFNYLLESRQLIEVDSEI